MKIAIIGSMASGEKSLNGQTVKTKVLIEELRKENEIERLDLINTSGKIPKLILFFRIFIALLHCTNIIILPAENGLRVIAPYLTFLNGIFKRSLHYDVIGGWLPDFIMHRPILKRSLKKFNYIYVETNSMKAALENQGINNVLVLPNAKELIIVNDHQMRNNTQGEIVFATFSRVMKSKGIEDAAIAIRLANNTRGTNTFHLDVYGFIEPNETDWFDSLQSEYQSELTYKGLIPFNQSTEVLKEYYGLLFPTYYSGEGFAGTLIDAFAAGLPVIASNWKYNAEIISDGTEGIIVPVHDTCKLAEAILWSYDHCEEWQQFKKNVIKKAYSYLPSEALVVLKKNLLHN